MGVRPVRVPASPGPAARGCAAQTAGVVLALGRLALRAVPGTVMRGGPKPQLGSARMKGVLATVAVVVLALCGATAYGGTRQLQHVTLIGDSVADAIPGDNQAVATLKQGIDLDLEVEPCRRVDQ